MMEYGYILYTRKGYYIKGSRWVEFKSCLLHEEILRKLNTDKFFKVYDMMIHTDIISMLQVLS